MTGPRAKLSPEQAERKRLAARTRGQRWSEACDAMKSSLESARDLAEEVLEALREETAQLEDVIDEDLEMPALKVEIESYSDKGPTLEDKACDIANFLDGFSTNDLEDLQNEFSDWLDNMPEGLRDGATGEKLQDVVNADVSLSVPALEEVTEEALENFISEIDGLLSDVDELAELELPRGFGRD